MAKAAMRPEVRAAKMRDNRTANLELACHVAGCKTEFYVAYEGKRRCVEHFATTPTGGAEDWATNALVAMGLIV